MADLTIIERNIQEAKKYLAKDGIKQRLTDDYIGMIFKLHPKIKMSSVIEHLNLVQLSGANPHKKQVYFTSYFSKKLDHSVGTTVFSYRFFEDVANQTGELIGCPCEVSVDEYFDPIKGEAVKTIKAVARAKRKGREDEVFTAWYPEFVQRKHDGTPNSMWKEKPYVMLRKCAVAGALRSQFPETLGSMLIQEEIKVSDFEEDTAIAEMEAASKETQKQIEQDKEKKEQLKNAKQKEPVVEEIKNTCGRITKGMSRDQKMKWLSANLFIDDFSRLKDRKLDDLKDMLESVQKKEKEAVVMDPPKEDGFVKKNINEIRDVRFKI